MLVVTYIVITSLKVDNQKCLFVFTESWSRNINLSQLQIPTPLFYHILKLCFNFNFLRSFLKCCFNFLLIGDGPLFPSMLDSSMISRSDTSGESGRGNGSMANLDQSGQDPSTQKYACSRCGRSYLHQVISITNLLIKS